MMSGQVGMLYERRDHSAADKEPGAVLLRLVSAELPRRSWRRALDEDRQRARQVSRAWETTRRNPRAPRAVALQVARRSSAALRECHAVGNRLSGFQPTNFRVSVRSRVPAAFVPHIAELRVLAGSFEDVARPRSDTGNAWMMGD